MKMLEKIGWTIDRLCISLAKRRLVKVQLLLEGNIMVLSCERTIGIKKESCLALYTARHCVSIAYITICVCRVRYVVLKPAATWTTDHHQHAKNAEPCIPLLIHT